MLKFYDNKIYIQQKKNGAEIILLLENNYIVQFLL